MNNTRSFFSRLRAAALLLALAWSSLAFGGEIHDAARDGDLEKVKALLKANPALVSSKDESSGCEPLSLAVMNSKNDMVELLLANKADVNFKGPDGTTALHWAADRGNKALVELLLKYGAEVNAKNLEGDTPLSFAMNRVKSHNQDDSVAKLLRQNGGLDPKALPPEAMAIGAFYDAVENNNLEDAKKLLKANPAIVDAKDEEGGTLLHWVALIGRKDFVELLLANKADVNARNKVIEINEITINQEGMKPFEVIQEITSQESMGGLTPLHMAALAGWKDVVELLLANKADVNAKDNDGWTPLHLAAMNDNKDVAEVLLANKANVDARDGGNYALFLYSVEFLLAIKTDMFPVALGGNTPLFYAVNRDHKDMVELLLASKANVNLKCSGGITPLTEAVDEGDIDMVKLLLAKGADVNATDDSGNMPLHLAARKGRKDMVELLLANKAEADARNHNNSTPFLEAVFNLQPGAGDVMELLLANKADVNAKDNRGWTALHFALALDMTDMTKWLLAHKAKIDNIQDAAALGDLATVKALVKANPDLAFARDSFPKDETPLHWAASGGHKDIAEFLVANKADINAEDNQGYTPLNLAVVLGNKELVEFLVANKADVNASSGNSDTPLFQAASRGSKDIVELLLAKGANVNTAPGRGSPLCAAATAGHKEVVELLLANKADVDAKDWNGYTPLHWAAHNGYKDVAELLLANKADVNAKDNNKETPLHLAALYGHKDVVELLLANKADVNAKDNNGRTPLDDTAIHKNNEIMDLLRQHGGHE